LEEVSSAFPGVLLNLDIKQTAPDVEPYEELLATELRRLDRNDSVIVAFIPRRRDPVLSILRTRRRYVGRHE